MTAGMAEVIAAHSGYTVKMPNNVNAPFIIACNGCGNERPIINEVGNVRTPPQRHAVHVAEELAKAGYGNVREAKAEAWQEGRESVAISFLHPLDEDGRRQAATNPYMEPQHG